MILWHLDVDQVPGVDVRRPRPRPHRHLHHHRHRHCRRRDDCDCHDRNLYLHHRPHNHRRWSNSSPRSSGETFAQPQDHSNPNRHPSSCSHSDYRSRASFYLRPRPRSRSRPRPHPRYSASSFPCLSPPRYSPSHPVYLRRTRTRSSSAYISHRAGIGER